jgi:hypothetical protein
MSDPLTKAQRCMLANAARGIAPYHPKQLTGGAYKNLRLLQERGFLIGHELTDEGRAALAPEQDK